jgi:hypothetical protein
MPRRLTQEEFVAKASAIHGDKYDYSHAVYQKGACKCIILCSTHGAFEQKAESHLQGSGCKKCAVAETTKKINGGLDAFLARAKTIHNKYDYSKVVTYENNRTKVTITCPRHGDFEQTPHNHLQGQGCKKCGDESNGDKSRKSKEEFVNEAKDKHGDRYDYSSVDYVNSNTVVTIKCYLHGNFLQRPYCHLIGQGCSACSGHKKLTAEEFIIRAKEKHGESTFDYSKVIYKTCDDRCIIICQTHGEFEQTPYLHLNSKHGCIKCSGRNLSTQDFICEAKKIHGELYDYSGVDYVDKNTHVKIRCHFHGEFDQKPVYHLFNCCGCPKCGTVSMVSQRKSTTDEFIQKAMKIHYEKYDYSKVDYDNSYVKVEIICQKHGIFCQLPSNHLSGQGCPLCGKSTMYSTMSLKWMAFQQSKTPYKIHHAENGGEYRVAASRYRADGYCPHTNTIYEFHGDYFHGNPKIHDPDVMNKTCNLTMSELYEKTLRKKQHILEQGYNYVEMWEYDWLRVNRSVIFLQRLWRRIHLPVLRLT